MEAECIPEHYYEMMLEVWRSMDVLDLDRADNYVEATGVVALAGKYNGLASK